MDHPDRNHEFIDWPATRGGRLAHRCMRLAARAVGFRHRIDFNWPRFEGGPTTHRNPLVLVHGFGVDGGTMLQLGRRLIGTHRVIVPDLPGFGLHGITGDAPITAETFLEGLDDLFEKLEITKPILVGSSMGGGIVATYAATRPEVPAGIVLIGPAGIEPPIDTVVFAAARRGDHFLKVDGLDAFDEIYRLNFVKPPWLPKFLRRIVVAEASRKADLHEEIFRGLQHYMFSDQEPYRSITCPTMVIWGDNDRIIHPSAKELWADAVPHARIEIVPNAGHSTMVEKPDDVAVLVEELVEEVRRGVA